MLSEAQIAAYRRDGYVIPDYRLGDEDLADIRAAHDRLLAKYPRYVNYCPTLLAHDLSFLNHARE